MDDESRRAHERFKDDQRVCRAVLEEASGGSTELSIIDMSAGGAALCDVGDSTRTPRVSGRSLTKGHIKIKVPSTSKRKSTKRKTVDVGTYEVVREWPRGLGDDAGIAVKFTKPRQGWLKTMAEQRVLTSLQRAGG